MEFFSILAQAATTTAPAAQPAAEQSWYMNGLLGWYVTGGWFMIPLFMCQVIGMGVIIERWLAYRAISMDMTGFRRQIQNLLARNQVDEAISLCDQTAGPVAATAAVGLRRYKLLQAIDKPAEQVEADVSKAIDDYGVHIVSILEKHLGLLATVTALAPLFGFLGTVSGMVNAFDAITREAGSGNIIQTTAAGIKEALITTVLGLCIAIPTQWFYNSFTNKVSGFVLAVEETATELIQNLSLMTALGPDAIRTSSESDEASAPASTVK